MARLCAIDSARYQIAAGKALRQNAKGVLKNDARGTSRLAVEAMIEYWRTQTLVNRIYQKGAKR